MAGRQGLVASSHCFVLQSWRADCFLSFIYCRRGPGLGSGRPGSARGYGESLGREGLWLDTKEPSRNPGAGTQAWCPGNSTQPFHFLPPWGGPLFVSRPEGGQYGDLSLAGSIKIILNPLFSHKSHVCWEAAIPGHLADIPSLDLH